jgi:hypothetical protein
MWSSWNGRMPYDGRSGIECRRGVMMFSLSTGLVDQVVRKERFLEQHLTELLKG